jgi:hypothetical protein
MDAGEFRRASAVYSLQTLIAATVHPLATGRFGDELIGKPMFSAAEIARRKREVKAMFHHGLVTRTKKKERTTKEASR